MLAPTIDAIAEQFGDTAGVVKVNVDDNTATAQRYGIKGIPTLILFQRRERSGASGWRDEQGIDLAHDREARQRSQRLTKTFEISNLRSKSKRKRGPPRVVPVFIFSNAILVAQSVRLRRKPTGLRHKVELLKPTDQQLALINRFRRQAIVKVEK